MDWWTATLKKWDPLQQRSRDHMHLGQQQSLILVGIHSQYSCCRGTEGGNEVVIPGDAWLKIITAGGRLGE